jgi:hypothetical protein
MNDKSPLSAIQDRSIYEDAHVFARSLFEQGKMSERDYENYFCLFQSMTNYLRPPTLVVFLRRSIPQLMDRIRLRGRDFEKGLSVDYLERLGHYYDEWFNSYEMGKSLMIDTDDMDFQHNPADFQNIVDRIESSLRQLQSLKTTIHDNSHFTNNPASLHLNFPQQ